MTRRLSQVSFRHQGDDYHLEMMRRCRQLVRKEEVFHVDGARGRIIGVHHTADGVFLETAVEQ